MRKLIAIALFLASAGISRAQSTISSNGLTTGNATANCATLNLGIAFSCQLVATGGVPVTPPSTYTWSETGTLPTGLTLTGGGLLSGTPTSSSAFPVTFKATDGVSSQSSISITLQAQTLTGTGPCGSAICVGAGIGSVNTSATLQLQALAYFAGQLNIVDVTALASWSCTAGAGCTGSSISAGGLFTAGTTTGSATAQATFGGVSNTAAVTVVSTATNPIITYPLTTLPNGQIYQAYSEGDSSNSPGQGVQLAASGGTPPYTWTVSAGGPLPTGLSLSSGGLISGTGTASGAGVTTTFQVADSAAHSNTVVISGGITIASVSSIVANLAQSSIPANTSTNASAVATYSDSSTGAIPSGTGGATRYGVSTGTSSVAATSVQVATGTATTTGDFAIGIVISYVNSACSGYSASITSANETFNAATTALGKPGAGAPFYNCFQMFYAQNITGNAADQPTCNWTATAGFGCLILYYHGMLTSGTLDQHPAPTQATSVSTCIPTAATTTAANELIAVFCGPNSPTFITPPSGFSGTAFVSNGSLSGVLSDEEVNSIQTSFAPSPTFSPMDNEITLFATFKSTSPANGTVTWSAGTPAVATVGSSTGVVTGQPVTVSSTSTITPAWTGSGSPTITAATVTVTPVNPTDTGIVVSPSSAFQSSGGTQVFSALGNVTGNAYSASWGSSNTAVATVNPSTGTTTTATCVGTSGTPVNISAAVSGFTSATATLTCSAASGQTINAADCSLASLTTAFNAITATTVTINLPNCAAAGSGTYTAQFAKTIPSTVTNLVIHGNSTVTCTGTAGTSSYACTHTDNTVLTDAWTGQNSPIWAFQGVNNTLRITGISFEGGNIGTTVGKPNGFITFQGSSTQLRVDHSYFGTTTYTGNNIGACFTIQGYIYGVADHIVGDMRGESNCVRDYPDGGGGDLAWSQASGFGGSNFMFVENSIVNGGFLNDCDFGGKMVMRYVSLSANANQADTGGWQGHQPGQGTATDRTRGCRALEAYHNYISNPTPSTNQSSVSGGGQTGMVFGNTITSGYNYDMNFWVARELATTHTQTNPPNGFGYCGTNSTGTGSNWDGNIVAATGKPCLDQTGRGQGDLLNGQNFPNVLNTATNSISWPHNMLEPWYVWNETIASNNYCSVGTWNGVAPTANQDFYCPVSASANTSPTSPFNGTTGTGFGPAANRPTTCTAGPGGAFYISPTGSYGVAYFATDANGGNGVLYVCTATNTWTQIYTPYTYPHPLDH